MNVKLAFVVALITLSPTLALADKCKPDCGHVTSIEKFKKEGQGSGIGAVAGGVAGALVGREIGHGTTNTVATIGGAAGGAYLGNMAEKKIKSKKMKRVHVKMDDGHTKSFEVDDDSPLVNGDHKLVAGERVQIRDGVPTKYTGK